MKSLPRRQITLALGVILVAACVAFLFSLASRSRVRVPLHTCESGHRNDLSGSLAAEGPSFEPDGVFVAARNWRERKFSINPEDLELSNPWSAEDAIPNEFVFGFYSASDQAAFIEMARARGIPVLGWMDLCHAVRIRVRNGEELRALIRDAPFPVEQAPNFYVRIPAPPVFAPYPGGYVGFGRHAAAWLGIPPGHDRWGEGITVAIVDNGVGSHRSLPSGRIVRVDMLSEDGTDVSSAGVHATAVCSIICGAGTDVAGVAPAVSILSIRALSEAGVGDAFTVARAIVEAVNRGARVINLCLGGRGDLFVLREAVRYAVARNVAVMAAVGNDGVEGLAYPARYDGVVAVAAADATGRHLFFSNRGPEIDIAAPGFEVTAAGTEDGFVSFSGTSAAVPFVVGALAALLSREPRLTTVEAIQALVECADDSGAPGKDDKLGYGILNVGRVLRRNSPGFCDVAVALPYVMPDYFREGVMTVLVYGQNRGTMQVAQIELVADVGGERFRKQFLDVGVGQIFSMPLQISTNLLARPGGFPIVCTAHTVGVTDQMPENNVISGVFFPSRM